MEAKQTWWNIINVYVPSSQTMTLALPWWTRHGYVKPMNANSALSQFGIMKERITKTKLFYNRCFERIRLIQTFHTLPRLLATLPEDARIKKRSSRHSWTHTNFGVNIYRLDALFVSHSLRHINLQESRNHRNRVAHVSVTRDSCLWTSFMLSSNGWMRRT